MVVYNDIEDLSEKIKELLIGEKWRDIGIEGYKRIQKDHSYDQRFKLIFDKIGVHER